MSTAVLAEVAPLLRGWLHLVCAVVTLPVGAFLVARADEPGGRGGAVVYVVGMFVMFSVSGLYHRGRWTPVVRPWMKRADHAAIFVMIGSTYTPICLVALRGGIGPWLLAGVWICVILGVVGALTGWAEKRVIGLVAYSAMGWAAVLAMPHLARSLSGAGIALLIAGGVLYSLGSIGLGLRWPNPVPGVFGYHEVWHVLVVTAVACHFAVVWSLVT